MMGKFLILAASWLGLLHPIHISVCEIDFDSNDKALEITQRIFLDDLEIELSRETEQSRMVLTEKTTDEIDELLKPYIERHVKVSVDSKTQKISYLGHEIENIDVVFIYYQIEDIRSLSSIEVQNTVLLGTYEDQVNIVHVSRGDKVRSLKLWREEYKGAIDF